MKVDLYSMFDTKVKMFHAPFPAVNDHAAKRNIAAIMARPENPYYDYAEDFILMKIGSFRDESGMLECTGTPEHVDTGVELSQMCDFVKTRRVHNNE